MIHVRSTPALVIVMALVLLAGCAKRPLTTQAAAPAPAAPTEAVASAPPAAPTAPAPAPAAPAPKEFVETAQLQDIHFDFDRATIRPDAARILEANADWLQTNRGTLILIEGHCDERGTNEYNLALGERRARSTRDYLVSRGVDAARITTISYGEERPLCLEHNESCWARNRRAHFLSKPR